MERLAGPEAWLELKRRAPEVTHWYDVGFYQHVFEGGRRLSRSSWNFATAVPV